MKRETGTTAKQIIDTFKFFFFCHPTALLVKPHDMVYLFVNARVKNPFFSVEINIPESGAISIRSNRNFRCKQHDLDLIQHGIIYPLPKLKANSF
jgi:hypothetical protein